MTDNPTQTFDAFDSCAPSADFVLVEQKDSVNLETSPTDDIGSVNAPTAGATTMAVAPVGLSNPGSVYADITSPTGSSPATAAGPGSVATGIGNAPINNVTPGTPALCSTAPANPAGSLAVKLAGVTKSYGNKLALAGLDMDVPVGAVYGLVGPNGAGKTTALHIICGAMRATSGCVEVFGQQVFENPLVKAGIASIPSDFFFHGSSRVEDLRALHAQVFPRFDNGRFNQLAPLFSIDPRTQIRSLSKGMQKQVAFWLALSQRPDVLLLDEPVDGLDPAARHRVWGAVMDEVAQRGMTVVTSSHNLRELTDVCDYVGIMDQGRMHLQRSLADLQDNFVKVQVAFADDMLVLPPNLDIIHTEAQGRLFTVVARADASTAQAAFDLVNPIFTNILPLSLEEIFLYELGGDHHGVIQ